MNIQSYYSKSFYSTTLNRVKYDALLAHAQKVRQLKNEISVEISSKLLEYLPLSKFDSCI